MSEAQTTSTVTNSTVVSHTYSIGFNGSFLKTFSAIAKLLEFVFLLCAFISSLVLGGSNFYGKYWTGDNGGSFVDAITIVGAICALVLFLLCLFGVWWKLPGFVRSLIECIWCWVFVVFSMTCAILSIKFAGPFSESSSIYSSAMSTGVFSCFALIVFSMDAMVNTIKLYANTGRALEPFFGIPLVVSSTSHTSQRTVQSTSAQMQFNDMNY